MSWITKLLIDPTPEGHQGILITKFHLRKKLPFTYNGGKLGTMENCGI